MRSIEINLLPMQAEPAAVPETAGPDSTGPPGSQFLNFFKQFLAMAGSREDAQGNPVFAAGAGQGRSCNGDGDDDGDRNCAFLPAGSLVPEIFPGLFLPSPGAANQPVEQPGSSLENNFPETPVGAVNGPRGARDTWDVWDAGSFWSVLSALSAGGGDPGGLAEVFKQTGSLPAVLPPGALVAPVADDSGPVLRYLDTLWSTSFSSAGGDSGQVLQSLLTLLWPADTAFLPPGQEKAGQTGASGVSFGSAGAQINPAQELSQFKNLLREVLFFFRRQGAAGSAGPEGNARIASFLLASGLKEALAAARSVEAAGAQTQDAGNPDLVAATASLRRALAALLTSREQAGPENFRGSAFLAGSGEGGGAANPGLEPAAGQQVQGRLPAQIIRPEGLPAAFPGAGGGKQQNSTFASISQPVLPESLFPGEKGFCAGTPGKDYASLIFNLYQGYGAAGAVHPGGGQTGVAPLLIPALVSQALQQAAGKGLAGETRLRFKLEPEHLGELVVRLVYRAGEVSAYFQASSAQAKEALEHSLPQLREALAGQNLHLQNASVTVGQESEFLPRENYGQPGYNYFRRGGGFQEPEADHFGSGPEPGRAPGHGRVNLWI